ncbi:unnamed protein product [Linum trigynum]|uniref:Retrotransposon gag domain-containing protein n=1 Tax=Linum trigynum TaxID=586398 RepID=A0AAV2D345_9ROSI
MFQEELCYQFVKSEGWAPKQVAAKLKQTGTVAEYRVEFLKLGNQYKGVPEETLVGLCMAGLKPQITTTVKIFEHDFLRTAFRLARHKEEELATWRNVIGLFAKASGGGCQGGSGGGCQGGSGGGCQGGSSGGASAGGSSGTGATITVAPFMERPGPGPRAPPKRFVRLSPAEIE